MSEKVEAAGSAATKTGAYIASSGLTVIGGMTAQEWAAIIGIIFVMLTFAVNWYYQHKRHQLAIDSFELKREIISKENTEDDHRCT